MPGFLSRSRSMRLLRGNRKDAQSEHAQNSMPRVGASQTDVDRYRSATPNAKGRHLETPDIAVRPSTSGGPVDRKTLFHMKTNPVPSVHSQNDLAFSLHSGSITTFYTAEVTDSSEGIIGIALGSPSLGSHWTPTPQASTFGTGLQDTDEMSTFTRPDSPSSFPVRQQPPKSKLGRWKSMFRKAAPPPPADKPSFYQLAQNVTATRAMRADSHQDDDSMKSNAEVEEERRRGGTPSPPAFKTNIRASRTFPAARAGPERPLSRARAYTAGSLPANPRVSVVRSTTNPLPPSKVVKSSLAPPKLLATQSARNLPTLSGDKPLLDVNIPDIKLERYSVMFGNLLQPTSDRSASLLVRRQGNAEKLKPLNKLTVKVSNLSLSGSVHQLTCKQENLRESPMDYKLQRRATSPVVPSPSPRLSLFPNTTSSRAASPRLGTAPLPKGLHRSKTEKSPLRNTFSRAEADWNKAQELFVRKPVTTTIVPPLKSSASMNLTVQKLSMTPTSATSFDSDTDSITLVVGRTASGVPTKLHLDDREPEWEICAKPAAPTRSHTTPASALKRADSKSQPTVTKLSALSSHPSSAPLEAPSPLQRIQQLQSPPLSAQPQPHVQAKTDSTPRAMVGVARSISVSRAGSPRTLVRTGSELRSPGDRLVEHRALTPTMVEVKNRRSQRVQLVDA
jgi:hypothetical protein